MSDDNLVFHVCPACLRLNGTQEFKVTFLDMRDKKPRTIKCIKFIVTGWGKDELRLEWLESLEGPNNLTMTDKVLKVEPIPMPELKCDKCKSDGIRLAELCGDD